MPYLETVERLRALSPVGYAIVVGDRRYRLRLFPLGHNDASRVGYVVMVRDVTAPLAGATHIAGWISLAAGGLAGGLIIFMILLARRVEGQIEEGQQALEPMAQLDVLTWGLNRRALFQVLEEEWVRAQRHRHPLAVAMIDLDFFKRLNDTYGQQVGDRVLTQVGLFLGQALRRGDRFGRYGGEELMLVLPETDVAEAGHLAERLIRQIEEGAVVLEDGWSVLVTASVGVAAWPMHGTNVEGLVAAADQALYIAKRDGRNRVVLAASAAYGSPP